MITICTNRFHAGVVGSGASRTCFLDAGVIAAPMSLSHLPSMSSVNNDQDDL